MSEWDDRNDACLNAVEGALRFLRRTDDERAAVRALALRFGSPAGILEAGAHELEKTDLTASEARLLALIPELTRAAQRLEFGAHPKLCGASQACEYLKTLYHGLAIEQFYALCMDRTGRLQDCALLQKGTLNEAPFYLGALLQKVVRTRAECVVLSHNHPGGTLTPSQADIDCTLAAARALKPLGVCLLDQIIIADGSGVSMRQNGWLPADADFAEALNAN